MGIVYRAQQLWRALHTSPTPEEQTLAATVLGPNLFALFNQMHPSEKAHSIKIYQDLQRQGEQDPDLLRTALLHDIGKSANPLQLWERVLIVIGKTLFPASARKWGQIEGNPNDHDSSDCKHQDWENTWRRAFIIAENHPAWGAEMASRAGAPEMTVNLIREHQVDDIQERTTLSTQERELLAKLQFLDSSN